MGRGKRSAAVAAVLEGYGVAPDRLDVVYSAVQVPAAPPARSAPRSPLRLLALGALVQHKGHDVLLRAMALTRQPLRLRVAGGGPLKKSLEALSRRLGLTDRVEFLGDLGDGSELFATSDLFVHPSRTEGLGTAVLDAMAAACPVLVSRAGGLNELLEGEAPGWGFPPGDPEALGAQLDAISELASAQPEELLRRGRSGWARARGRHGISEMVQGVQEVYDRLQLGKEVA